MEDIRRLKRKENEEFFIVNTLHTLKLWNLPSLATETANSDIVIISYDTQVCLSAEEIQITNPVLLYPLPEGNEEDEYLVLFVSSVNYLSDYCEKHVLSFPFMNRLIERKDKLSSHSTKLITLRTFRSILKRFNDLSIEKEQCPKLCKDFVQYLRSLTENYPYLGYLPLTERKLFRKMFISDAGFAWGFYVQFFLDEWSPQIQYVELPDLSKPFNYEGWTGDFFHRKNPIWNQYLSSNGKYRFNEATRESAYQIWKEWIK